MDQSKDGQVINELGRLEKAYYNVCQCIDRRNSLRLAEARGNPTTDQCCQSYLSQVAMLEDAEGHRLDFRTNQTMQGLLGLRVQPDGSVEPISGVDLVAAKARLQQVLLIKLLPLLLASRIDAEFWRGQPNELVQADPARWLPIVGADKFKDDVRSRFGAIADHVLDGVLRELAHKEVIQQQRVSYNSPWSKRTGEETRVLWPGPAFLSALPTRMADVATGVAHRGPVPVAAKTGGRGESVTLVTPDQITGHTLDSTGPQDPAESRSGQVVRDAPRAARRAAESYEWVCSVRPDLIPAPPGKYAVKQWEHIRDHDCPAYHEETAGRQLQVPDFETWKRQVRAGLADSAAPRTSPRAGREQGSKSIVRPDQI